MCYLVSWKVNKDIKNQICYSGEIKYTVSFRVFFLSFPSEMFTELFSFQLLLSRSLNLVVRKAVICQK